MGKKPLSTVASRRQKKGACRGKNQRQQTDGGGRRSRDSSRRLPLFGFTCRSDLDRDHIGFTRAKASRQPLIADKADDSRSLRQQLADQQIELRDGRPLRRDRKGWEIERTIGWRISFGCIAKRRDRQLTMYRAFFHVAGLIVTIRYL